MSRRFVFISHVNERVDNAFAEWLALKLTAAGYSSWCDRTELVAGDHHWTKIQEALDEAAVFVYVLSDASNKSGPVRGSVNELEHAIEIQKEEGIEGFVVPIQIRPLTSRLSMLLKGADRIDAFEDGWASALSQLIRALDARGAPRREGTGALMATATWQRQRYSARRGVTDEAERLRSNWFPTMGLPQTVYHHSLEPKRLSDIKSSYGSDLSGLPYPAREYTGGLISFATAAELGLGPAPLGQASFPGMRGVTVRSVPLDFFLQGGRGLIRPGEARKVLYALLRTGWERHLVSRGLRRHDLSGGRGAYWFPTGFSSGDKVGYEDWDGRARRPRQLVGVHKTDFMWHFAVSGHVRFAPFMALEVRSHVLFSNDGDQLWESDRRLHSARRAHGRSVYNDVWRDRLHAAMAFVAEGGANIAVPLSSAAHWTIRTGSATFESPVSYGTPVRSQAAVVDGMPLAETGRAPARSAR